MLIDTHCHVLKSEYDNPRKVIEESLSNGVEKIIINGFDMESSIEAVSLSNEYDNVYCAIGIGPENIDSYNEDTIALFQKIIDENHVVAIGEIGIDYYWTTETKEKQIKVFKEMLSLAKNNNLPVIVHSRNATEDTYKLLKAYNVTGIIHCFSGSLETAVMYQKLGFLLGIGGVVTFKNAKKLLEVVEKLDLSSFSLETDSPYLTPEPNRGKKNYPYYISYVAAKIADIKKVSVDDVINETAKSVMSKFDL